MDGYEPMLLSKKMGSSELTGFKKVDYFFLTVAAVLLSSMSSEFVAEERVKKICIWPVVFRKWSMYLVVCKR